MGFIHTHPTFSAFLSSIDLHMAAHIQNSIPEAIAIVVSEKDRTQPIFRITPEGMEILNKCDKQQLLHHTHSRDVTLYEECEVKYSKEDTIIKDMRKISDESTVMNLSIPSLPDLDIPREASTRIRDSFDRSGFNNLSFTKSVIPKGRPRKDKGGAPSFKPTKPSKSVGTITKKRKCADNANDETSRENEPAPKRPRGRPKGSKNVKKNDKNLKQKKSNHTAAEGNEYEKCWTCHDDLDGDDMETKCPKCELPLHQDCLRGDGCPVCGDDRDVPGGLTGQ